MKKFLIIGNANAITYKEVFPSIVNREIFVRTAKGTVCFVMYFTKDNGEKALVPSVWFTNLDSRHLYKTLELTKTYDPAKYPRYDNYDAIEVSCIKDIPKDYDGVMGVPISIVLFSPEQFEIIWRSGDIEWAENECPFYTPPSKEQAEIYKKQDKTWRIQNTYLLDKQGKPNVVYQRIFIKSKADIINGGVFNNPYIDGKQKYKRILIRKKDDN